MAVLLLPISFIAIGELVFVNCLQIILKKAVLHLLQSLDSKPLVQLQAHVAFDHFDVERGGGTPKLPAESGRDDFSSSVLLFLM
jgi:hypothetical protein